MKKILCIALAIIGFSAYALPWEEATANLTKFFDDGNAVYIAENKNNLLIIPKANIRRVEVDEDEVGIIVLDDDKEKEYEFKKNRHAITLDANMNLIITKK